MKKFSFIFALMATTIISNNAWAESGNCGGSRFNCTWTLSDAGELSISGTQMLDYGYGGYPWDSLKDKVTSIKVNDGIQSIGGYAFNGFTNLQSVKIADSVTTIYDGAFANSSIKSIKLPASLTHIGYRAFEESTLSDVDINASLTKIGQLAFDRTQNLKSITIPDTVEEIVGSAFAGSGLTSIEIKGNNTKLDKAALIELDNLTELTIPDGLNLTGTYEKDRIYSFDLDDEFMLSYMKRHGITDEQIDDAKAYFDANPGEYEYPITAQYNVLEDLDLSKVTIKCSGDSQKCKANLDASGLTGYNLVDKDGYAVGASGIAIKPVTTYTVATATEAVENVGGCEEPKCSLKMWFK